jgi:adenylate cyclase
MRLRDLVGGGVPPANPWLRWLERLISVGIVAGDPQVVRRQRIVNVSALATASNALSHWVINAFYDFHGLMVINIYNLLMIAAVACVPVMHRIGPNVGAVALSTIILGGNLFVVWALGLTSLLHIYFTLAGAMLLFFGVEQWRLFLILYLMWVAGLLVALNFAPADGFVMPGDDRLRGLMSRHAMINTIAINAVLIFYALSALRRAETELQGQHRISEALIATVLPLSIADRLKSGEPRIADRIDMLTVLFADLAGFTEAAHDLAPEAVVDYLDGLVRGFDALCERSGVEKIKTIGDNYMAAAGFAGSPTDAAGAVGALALDMMTAIACHPPLGSRRMTMRIGIHSGPATAGVIGDHRFSFDVWGDAVNVASRMESHGVPERIQVSDAFRAMTADRFRFEERGSTDLKGLGSTRTYFLIGPHAGP